MNVFVYTSQLAKNDATAHNFLAQLERFAAQVEKTQSIDLFDRFPQPHIKKAFGRQIRLLARERFIQDDVVICFTRVLIRGSAEYTTFLSTNQIPKGDRIDANPTDETLLNYIQFRRENERPPQWAPPSDTECQFLFGALSDSVSQYDDYVCCETQLWFDRIKQPQFADRISQYQGPVFETFGEPTGEVVEVRLPNAPEFGFVFRHFARMKTILLLAPFRGRPDRSLIDSRYPEFVAPAPCSLPHETILRKTRQAYPLSIADNPDAWFEIEKDTEGNIALSYEEVDVLDSPKKSDEGFPLFINGRAGSGKSTILQYLFSDYLYFYFKNRIDGRPPIFFACNDDLIMQAKKSVSRIIAAKNRVDPRSDSVSKSVLEDERFDEAFANFHRWLSELPHARSFVPGNRIDYGEFKKWWARRFANEPAAARLYGPDVSWHIIRSYIKGSNADHFLDPDDYAEIAGRQKSVSQETYQLVFDRVWPRYADDQEELGLWDDQDLAREALIRDLIPSERPVVFCDEAQDFTRVDLEALFRLSLFSERSLQGYQVLKVPFAFAGDPFQTLNPTGFRWEATKTHFIDKFVKRHRDTHGKTDLNYCELTYNYRSTRNIVRFCNTLQLVRSILFDIPEIRPQIPWFDEPDSPMPVYFDYAELDVMRRLSEESEIRIIVPCEEGGEGDYLKQHPELDRFVQKDDLGVPKNVVSPMRVKGLEFKRVVLFGFGDSCPLELLEALREPQVNGLRGDRSIETQYFLNRLYVGASRPRRRLFIVDSRTALETFWSFASDENSRDEFALRAGDAEIWKEASLGLLAKGRYESWSEDREDALETAHMLAGDGRLRKDRVLLRQAAQSYFNAGNPKLALQCRAEALEIEEEYLKANDIYIQLDQLDNALKACWKAGIKGLDRILSIGEQFPRLQTHIQYAAARFIKVSRSFDDGVALLKDVVTYLDNIHGKVEAVTEPTWRDVMGSVQEKLIDIGDDSHGTWKVVANYFEKIRQAGLHVSPLALAGLHFRAGDLDKANLLWSANWECLADEQRKQIEPLYYQSQAFVTDYPEKLLVLDKLLGGEGFDASAAVIAAFEQSGGAKLRDEHWNVVAKALMAKGQTEQLFDTVPHLSGESILVAIMNYSVQGRLDAGLAQTVPKLIALWDRESEWRKIIDLWTRGAVTRMELPAHGRVTWDDEMNRMVAEAAAQSATLRSEDNSVRTALSENISRVFMSGFGWADRIHPLIIGAAFEAGGLYRHIFPYYERVEANLNFHPNTRIGAARRWAKLKERQLRLEGSRRSTRVALEEKMASLHLSDLSRVPDLPNLAMLPPLYPETQPPNAPPLLSRVKQLFTGAQQLDEVFGVLRVSVSQDRRRINLENTESLEQGTVFPALRRVIIDGVEVAHDLPVVDLLDWGYSIEFSSSEVIIKDEKGDTTSVSWSQ